jgi:hypothetical protein
VVHIVTTAIQSVKPITETVRSKTLNLEQFVNGFESRCEHVCLYSVFVVCLAGCGLCEGLIPRLEESDRLCVCGCVCVGVCDLGTSTARRPRTKLVCCAIQKIQNVNLCIIMLIPIYTLHN